MGNSKKFILSFECNNLYRNEFVKVIKEELCSSEKISDPKFITYLHHILDTIILATSDNTYWDSDKIKNYIHDKIEGKNWNSKFMVIEITDRDVNGYMPDKFWKTLRKYQDISQYVDDMERVKKLKKIKSIMDEKEEIKKREELIKIKEQELKKKEEELVKELERKKILDELKRKEDELKEKEKELDKKLNDAKSWWKTLLKI